MLNSFIKPLIITATLASVSLLSACSTRQVLDEYSGSTAQRLITYSVQKLAKEFKAADFEPMRDKNVYMQSHFIAENQDLIYAHDYITMELRRRFGINIVEKQDADYIFDLFFLSLGTDQDTYGLSIPLTNLSDPGAIVSIDILAMDMYHGITEAKLFVTDVSTKTIVARKQMLARVRTDKVSTLLFSFPVSSFED